MSVKTFTEEFKIEAVKQITEQGYPVSEVSSRLGVSTNSLYAWVKRYHKPEPQPFFHESKTNSFSTAVNVRFIQ